MLSIGVAVFVKTPGHSAIKTRLAKDIGSAAALEFYIESLKSTHDLLEQFKKSSSAKVDLYWAVAEAPAKNHLMWRSWPNIIQVGEDLGSRMASVYETLKKKHDVVLLLGADCPHLPLEFLEITASKLNSKENAHVIGPSEDGGFYLFASTQSFESAAWDKPTYSTGTTRIEFEKALGLTKDTTFHLPELFDIDTGKDFARFRNRH